MSFLIGIIAQRSAYERHFGKQQTLLPSPAKKCARTRSQETMRQFPERLTMKMVQRPFVCGYVTTHGRSGRTVRPCSGHKNRSSLEPAGTKIREGMVGLFEWIARGLSDNANLRRQAQEIDSILPCEIGDRQKLSLCSKDLVREAWDVAHMDAGTNDTTAFANRLQRQGHQIANGRKENS